MPSIYQFPPLYTRQPNLLIRQKQLETWVDIIAEYCKENKQWIVSREGDVGDSANIFRNTEINRSVPQLFVNEIWSEMVSKGKAIAHETSYYVLWRDMDSWSSLILQWFETVGKLNQVVTLYELVESDETLEWEFHGMPEPLLQKCLKPLCVRNRATLMKDENGVPVAIKVV